MLKRSGKRFVDASNEAQTAMLDALVRAGAAETAADTAFDTNDYRRFAMYGVRQAGGYPPRPGVFRLGAGG